MSSVDTPFRQALEHSEKLGLAFAPSAAYWRAYYADRGNGSEPIGAERLRIFGDALTCVGAGGLWLDAGCGIGVMARHFRDSGLRLCGIDASGALLEEAQSVTGLPLVTTRNAPLFDEHLCRVSVERTPYDNEHFDGVYSSSVLEYCARLDLALAELCRVVRRGGHLVFNLPNASSVFRLWHAVRYRRHEYYQLVPRWAYSRSEIVRVLMRSGWEPRRLSYYGAERFAPGLPAVLPPRVRRRLATQAWAASFVLVVATKR